MARDRGQLINLVDSLTAKELADMNVYLAKVKRAAEVDAIVAKARKLEEDNN